MIKVGDKVRIKSESGVYTTYIKWLTSEDVFENVHDYLGHYRYGRNPPDDHREWKVVFIAPHVILRYVDVALIDDGKECYMFSTGALEPVNSSTSNRMTNRELCRWLAEGNGEVLHDDQGKVGTWHCYVRGDDDVPVHENVKIRSWNETDWREPLKEEEEIEEEFDRLSI